MFGFAESGRPSFGPVSSITAGCDHAHDRIPLFCALFSERTNNATIALKKSMSRRHFIHLSALLFNSIYYRYQRRYMAEEREIRLQRLHALREQGLDPYPHTVERTHTIADALDH